MPGIIMLVDRTQISSKIAARLAKIEELIHYKPTYDEMSSIERKYYDYNGTAMPRSQDTKLLAEYKFFADLHELLKHSDTILMSVDELRLYRTL